MSLDTAEGRHKECVGRADHCLKMAKIASNPAARVIQRQWAVEWLKLADTQFGALVGSSKCKWDDGRPPQFGGLTRLTHPLDQFAAAAR